MHFILSPNMYHLLSISALFQITFSMTLGPAPTQFHSLNHEEMAMNGVSPAPTPAPRRRSPASLFERQIDTSVGAETCGFWSADWNKPLTCASEMTCYFGKTIPWFACCSNKANCAAMVTQCVPGDTILPAIEDASILTCTKGTSTKCVTFFNVWNEMGITYTGYTCDYMNRVFTVSYNATNIPKPTPSLTYTPPAPTPNSQPSTPVGSIVGGVIGGIAALAIIGFGMFFLIRRKRTVAFGPSQPISMTGQGHPASTIVSTMNQNENSKPSASQVMDAKGAVPIASPSSPTPPYQPPYSPPPQMLHAHDAHISQLP